MKSIGYIGLDIHKKVIAFCIKTNSGAVLEEGKIDATRHAITGWVSRIDRPWIGAEYNKNQLHGKGYFDNLLITVEDVPESVIDLLKMSRASLEMFQGVEKRLRNALKKHHALRERVERLSSISGVGDMTALTWALEIGDVSRFSSRRKVISYCGLCSAQKESAGKSFRSPLSKDRNKHLQTVLVEAAKIAPRWNPELAALYERELARGNRNRATLAVARKLAV